VTVVSRRRLICINAANVAILLWLQYSVATVVARGGYWPEAAENDSAILLAGWPAAPFGILWRRLFGSVG